jgi:phosphohistidine phosphatase
MDVLLVRHAAAVSATGRLRDEERWLTPEGRASSLRVGAKLNELGMRPTAVYTSPLVRAVQTTELLVRAMGDSVHIGVHPPLAVDTGTIAEVLAILDRHAAGDTIMLVTHEPKVRSLASKLGRLPRFPAFATAGVSLFRGPLGALDFVFSLDPVSLTTTTDPLEVLE